MRLLIADIGNTTIRFGFLMGEVWAATERTSSRGAPESALEAARVAVNKLVSAHGPPAGAVVSSVVPSLTAGVRKLLQGVAELETLEFTHDTPLPLTNGYGNPRQVGLDRLANAVGGVETAGAPMIVVDAGTAVTLDVVGEKKVFLGGAILPGHELWAHSLADYTAALPHVVPRVPERAIGNNTEANIQSGILFGLAGAIDRLVELTRAELGSPAPALLTGGAASLLSGLCRNVSQCDENLTLLGLAAIYRHARTPRF